MNAKFKLLKIKKPIQQSLDLWLPKIIKISISFHFSDEKTRPRRLRSWMMVKQKA